MTPLLGFIPDADPTTPGIITDCTNLEPYEAGFRGAPTPVTVGVAALSAECRGAVVATKLDGTRRLFAGTQTKLYELAGTTWVDRSAGAYTGSSESRWSYCQFGDTTIATNLGDAMQSSASGAFAAIAGAPKAKVVVSATNNFVIAFNTNEAVYGSSPDRWWCCAQNDQTNWTPSVTTSANTGRLIGVEGAIQAALPLGDYVVAYKSRGVFLGVYVGGAVVWQWNLIPGGECGAIGQDAVCDIGGAHFIVSNDNFWIFDGTRPIPIGTGVNHQWFIRNSSYTFRYRTKVVFDKQNALVRIYYPSATSTGACDACLVYHIGNKKWGRNNITVEAPLYFIAPGITIDGLDAAYSATIDGLPSVPLDSPYWLTGGQLPAVFDTTHSLMSLTGTCGSSGFITGDMGDDDAVTCLERVRIRFLLQPATASCTGRYTMNEGGSFTDGATNTINDGKFNLRQSGRFHRLAFTFTGDHKESAIDAVPIKVGKR
jgi:hypothetical protein